MVLTVMTNNIKNIKKYIKNGATALIFDLKDFSTNNTNITVSKIKKIVDSQKDIEVFVNMNKMIFNKDIKKLEKVLIELSDIKIKAIMFYDLAILEIVKENKLNIDLVWNNTHMITNYNTCNYFYNKGVKYANISSEITLEEIIEIKNKSNIIPLVKVLGHETMAHSRRKLLTNYFNYNNASYDNKTHQIKHMDSYLIKENKTGTTILDNTILNGSIPLKELIENKIPYIVLNDDEIEQKVFLKLITYFNGLIENYNDNTLSKIEKLIGNNTGFFYKKTIYKVK